MSTPRLALTTTGDLDFSTGSLRIETDEVKNIVGKVRKVLLLFQGAWFLAANDGVPWFQQILAVKNPDLRVITNLLTDAILTVPEVARVTNFVLDFNRTSRVCTVTCNLITTAGAIPFTNPLAVP
jgi:hypothetical protein